MIGRELDRVLEQVPNDLLELGGVSRDVMRATAQVEIVTTSSKALSIFKRIGRAL